MIVATLNVAVIMHNQSNIIKKARLAMKTVFALLLGATLSTAIFASTPNIPKQYQGVWAGNAKSCKLPKNSPIDFPDTGARIGSQGINQYESYCELKALSKNTANSIKGAFICSVEGDESKITLTLTLLVDGKLAGLNDKPLVRCN